MLETWRQSGYSPGRVGQLLSLAICGPIHLHSLLCGRQQENVFKILFTHEYTPFLLHLTSLPLYQNNTDRKWAVKRECSLSRCFKGISRPVVINGMHSLAPVGIHSPFKTDSSLHFIYLMCCSACLNI